MVYDAFRFGNILNRNVIIRMNNRLVIQKRVKIDHPRHSPSSSGTDVSFEKQALS